MSFQMTLSEYSVTWSTAQPRWAELLVRASTT